MASQTNEEGTRIWAIYLKALLSKDLLWSQNWVNLLIDWSNCIQFVDSNAVWVCNYILCKVELGYSAFAVLSLYYAYTFQIIKSTLAQDVKVLISHNRKQTKIWFKRRLINSVYEVSEVLKDPIFQGAFDCTGDMHWQYYIVRDNIADVLKVLKSWIARRNSSYCIH